MSAVRGDRPSTQERGGGRPSTREQGRAPSRGGRHTFHNPSKELQLSGSDPMLTGSSFLTLGGTTTSSVELSIHAAPKLTPAVR